MAGPGLVFVITLILIFVPLWTLIWGQKEQPPTLSPIQDPVPPRSGLAD
jgi:hypothetical protein